MAKEPRVYDNNWSKGKFYRDTTSHFLRMNDNAVSEFFNDRSGIFANSPNTPNWVSLTDEGYEMVRMDGSECVSRTGFFITLTASDKLSEPIDVQENKGKVIADWNFHFVLPNLNSENDAIHVSSDDTLKSIVCYKDGSMYSFPCRMQRAQNSYTQRSQLIMKSLDGVFAHTPFVNLAFFMWLEEVDAGRVVGDWLRTNMGWVIASTE